jgi:hypothetical protein
MLPLALLGVACTTPENTVSPRNDDPVGTDTPVDTEPADTASDTDANVADSGLPSDYVYDEEDDVGALLDADGVAGALEEALGSFLRVDPFLILAGVDDAVEADDATCPYHYTDYEELYGYDYWYGDCSTSDGTDFTGYLYGIHYDPFESYGYLYDNYGWWYGDMAIDRADGQRFDLSGYWSMYQYTYMYYPLVYSYAYAYGEPRWEGADYGDTWLGAGASVSFTAYAYYYEGAGTYFAIDGGISALEGTANSIWFDGVYIATAGQGSDCPIEPSGTISIRDDAGDWYDVEFQGPAYYGAATFPPECDGCGDVWYEGSNLGQACIDFSEMTDWEGSPW